MYLIVPEGFEFLLDPIINWTIKRSEEVKRGTIKAQKNTHFIHEIKTEEVNFDISYFENSKIGVANHNCTKEFSFPLDLDVLKFISRFNMLETTSPLYKTWADCDKGKIKIYTELTKKNKQGKYKRLCKKYDEEAALKKIPKFFEYIINVEDLMRLTD